MPSALYFMLPNINIVLILEAGVGFFLSIVIMTELFIEV